MGRGSVASSVLWDHRPVGRAIRRSAAPALRLAVTKDANLTNTRSTAVARSSEAVRES
jgi:hypothetical protein